jgi:hypothetical protein
MTETTFILILLALILLMMIHNPDGFESDIIYESSINMYMMKYGKFIIINNSRDKVLELKDKLKPGMFWSYSHPGSAYDLSNVPKYMAAASVLVEDGNAYKILGGIRPIMKIVESGSTIDANFYENAIKGLPDNTITFKKDKEGWWGIAAKTAVKSAVKPEKKKSGGCTIL